MKYLGYSVNSGSKNMEIDAQILENAIASSEKDILFRLYGWSPMCISLGRNQKGDFLTYCCVAPVDMILNGQSVVDSYKYISGVLIDFFKTLGVELDFGENKRVSTHYDYCMLLSTGADVCYKGQKIIGSAQCRKNGYILQHGSILFGYDKSLLERLFNEQVQGIITVNEILPNLTKQEFIERFEKFIKLL